MGLFTQKTWKDRVVQFASRRKLTQVSVDTYDVARAEGTVAEAGDALNASNMNALETRISDAFDAVEVSINGKAAASHNHSATEITSGTLPATRGGTGRTSIASIRANLASATAANALAGDIGVTGTLPVGSGGTGATDAAAARTNLGAADASHNHTIGNLLGVLSTLKGGTGASSPAAALSNLGGLPASAISSGTTSEGSYLALPGNISIQWGMASASGGEAVVYLPAGYTNTAYSMVLTPHDSTAVGLAVKGMTMYSFTVACPGATTHFRWLTIGFRN